MSNPAASRRESAPILFTVFKYALFALLTYNLYYYLLEDLNTYRFLPVNASVWQVLENFAVTIDFVVWMILIVIFELETGPLSEKNLKGWLKSAFNGTVGACYVILLYAGWGYVVGLVDFYQFEPIASETVCELLEEDYASLSMEARFIPLTRESCTRLSSGDVFKHRTDRVISDQTTLDAGVNLGWVDVFNAGAWLLVVLLFEIEILFKSNHALTRQRFRVIKASKVVLYLTLLGCAIYWTFYGAFIDYWDAYLWLLAFILIDLNLFDFQKHTAAVPATAES